MALGNLTVDTLLHPADLIAEGVAPFLHQVKAEAKLRVYRPNEEEAVVLKTGDGELLDLGVGQRVIGNGDPAGRVGRRELPWRVHHDHVKELAGEFPLLRGESLEVEGEHIGRDGYAFVRVLADGRFD